MSAVPVATNKPQVPHTHPHPQPREYQLELFRRACSENIIAFLETGAGKTLIAALLLRHVLNQDETLHPPPSNTKQKETNASSETSPDVFPARKRRMAVFLVHRVPLVPQQAAVVRSVLPNHQHVGAYFGEKGVNDWSSSKWAKSLCTKHVVVMTAQIFLNLLRHGLIDIRDVSLLVIDEVHHATKSHPYRRIFLEFYHTLQQDDLRPRIFGMTATPVKRKASSVGEMVCLHAIAALEATLDATVVTVSDKAQQQVESLVPKPEEFVITYKTPAITLDKDAADICQEDIDAENAVLSKLSSLPMNPPPIHSLLDVDDDGDVPMDGMLEPAELRLVEGLRQKLGYKAAADFAVQLCTMSGIAPTATLDTLLVGCEEDLRNGGLPDNVAKLLDALFAECIRCRGEPNGPDVDGEDMKDDTDSNTESETEAEGDVEEEADGSPHKVERDDADAFRCIIFIQERTTALCLTWLINLAFGKLDKKELTARCVVGAQNSESYIRMSQSKLIKTIDDFRNGEYGILVSTNVVEEGIDIPACRLVVAFDQVMSPTAYVQGRGRARKQDARYITFIQEGCEKAYKAMDYARRGARVMKEVTRTGPLTEEGRRQTRALYLVDVTDQERALKSKTTRARVTATQAISLLHRYCAMKGQSLGDEGQWQPTYSLNPSEDDSEPGVIATVKVHPRIAIDGGFCWQPQATELVAKRYAALDAYSKLYKIGEVDEYLLPRRQSRSKRVLTTTSNAPSPAVKALGNRGKQKNRREVASKASKKSNRVRRCSIVHPKVIQTFALTASEDHGSDIKSGDVEYAKDDSAMTDGDSSDEEPLPVANGIPAEDETADSSSHPDKLYVYSISLDEDMDEHEWYPLRMNERFGLLVRDLIASEDLEAMKCPYGNKLFTLTCIGELPWTSSMQQRAYQYVRFIQLCLRGRAPGSPLAIEIAEKEYSKSVNPGFFLLPLSPDSAEHCAVVDWTSIECLLSFGWRCGPMEEATQEAGSVEHVLVCSYHENCNRVYMAGNLNTGFRAEAHPSGRLNSSYDSFVQYYLKKHNVCLKDHRQFMLEGYSVREVMSNLSASCFMLAPETCRIIPLSPLACYITSLLPMWQTFLALRVCWRRNRLEENPVDFLSFARALQPNINNVAKGATDLSYERLEFLGDAVLKVIYSMVMFVKHPDDSEGLLSDERDVEVSNQRLANLALEMRIQHCIAFSGVSQKVKSWPWFWATHQRENIDISEKVLADCVESLIGAQYLHGGIELATLFVDRHKLLIGACDVLKIEIEEVGQSEKVKGVLVPPPPMDPGDTRASSDFVAKVEEIIQYKFRDKRHLVVALTHGSYKNGLISSYQRYEYLGDAIIGFILLSYFFEKYPNLCPGKLTTLRGPALSNDLFARVIVSWGIHYNFWHNCNPLEREISRFAQLFANEEDDEEDISKSMTVPKVLGDLLESIIGAIVVDKGMRLDGIQEIVLRLMDEELNRFCNPDRFRHNPVSQLVRVVQGEMNCLPKYEYEDEEDGSVKKCIIYVAGEEYGRGVGPTRRVAKRRASMSSLQHFDSDHGAETGLVQPEAGLVQQELAT